MQSQNLTKINVNDSYYHVNINSVDKQNIYCDEEDYQSFLSLFEKYILKSNSAEILAYCLMSNRFDLLLCQTDEGSVARFMHNVVIAYNEYYYSKYQAEDLLSEGNLEISKVSPDNLLDISRHIHISSDDWMDYPFSSIRAYLYDDVPKWLNKTHIAEKYGSAIKYLDFLQSVR
ncbi:MAG TPA: hypothetical protein VFD55_00490 [Candidatus Angelobacter sp.]|nr:hypothetical protein [Candidatus Angelobacter sp.]